MPHPTLYGYFCDENPKRQLIGTSAGKNSTLLNCADIDFMLNVLVRVGYGNNGMCPAEATDAIQETNTVLDRKQAKDQLDWRVLTKSRADGKIDRRTLKAQATTTERSAITYQSQWRWYGFVTGMFNDLWKKNVAVCKNNFNTFGELMQNFVLGLDEACIMADAGINIRIVGASNRKQNENIIS